MALLGMSMRGGQFSTAVPRCEFGSNALADASQLPSELHEGIKQAVDIYNMVHPGPLALQKTGDYHTTLRLPLPKSTTEIELDITAIDKFPNMDDSSPFPDNVTNVTTQIIDRQSAIPYAKQSAEKHGSAWTLTGSYLTKRSLFGDSYQMTSVATTGGVNACAYYIEYSVQNDGRHVAISSTSAEMSEAVEVAHDASRIIVGQLVAMAGAQQHFNLGIMDYKFPTQDAKFLDNFGVEAPVNILQPPESKLAPR